MENIERIYNVVGVSEKGFVPVARDILACVNDFQGSVYIEKDNRTVSARSMVGVLSLGLQNGDTVKVTCSGEDEFSVKLCLEKIGTVIA